MDNIEEKSLNEWSIGLMTQAIVLANVLNYAKNAWRWQML